MKLMRLSMVILYLSLASFMHAQLVEETASLTDFLYGRTEDTAYDNWLSRVVEGIGSEGYNQYAPFDVQSDDFGTFINPDFDQLMNWTEVIISFTGGDYEEAQQTIDLYGFPYDVVIFNDTDSERTYYMLRERINPGYFNDNNIPMQPDMHQTGSFDYGWGLYIFNPAGNTPINVNVVHPKDDFISVPIANEAFRRWNARYLMIAGASREAMWDEEGGSFLNNLSISDPSRNEEHPFNVAYRAFCDEIRETFGRREFSAQIHSFDYTHMGYNNLQISAGNSSQNYPGLPIRDFSDSWNDMINASPFIVHPANSIGEHDDVLVTDYYSVLRTQFHVNYNNNGDIIRISGNINLPGYGGNRQVAYTLDGWNKFDTYSPFFHIEMEELPSAYPQDMDTYYWFYGYDSETGLWDAENLFTNALAYYIPWVEHLGEALNSTFEFDDGTPPTNPTNIRLESTTETTARLRWNRSRDFDFYSYEIIYSQEPIDLDNPNYETVDREQIPELACQAMIRATVTGLEPETQYYFRIRAKDYHDNHSAFSNETNRSWVRVAQPIGGEKWSIGAVMPIRWNCQFIDTVQLQYSVNDGAQWILIEDNIPAPDSLYLWEVPDFRTDEALIRISSPQVPGYTHRSPNNFTLRPLIEIITPVGGENYTIGRRSDIRWALRDSLNYVDIFYSTDAGEEWTQINNDPHPADSGRYEWLVPNTPSRNCMIKIDGIDNDLIYNYSDSLFTIGEKALILLSPTGNEEFYTGTAETIEWEAVNVNNIRIEYSLSRGDRWRLIEESYPAADGSFNWHIPFIPTNEALIKITDITDSRVYSVNDTLFVIRPNIPDIPMTVGLPDSSINVSTRPVISWHPVTCAQYYQLQVSSDSLFVDLDFQRSFISDTSQVVTSLDFETTYYWRLRGRNYAHNGEWTDTYTFSTRQPLAIALPDTLRTDENDDIRFNLYNYLTCLPDDELTVTFSESDYLEASIEDETVTITPLPYRNGFEQLVIEVSGDTRNGHRQRRNQTGSERIVTYRNPVTVRDTLTVEIRPVNNAPIVTEPLNDIFIRMNSIDSTSVNFDSLFYDPDLDPELNHHPDAYDSLRYGWSEPEHLNISYDDESGFLFIRPEENWTGRQILVLTATDIENLTAVDTVLVHITGTAANPTFYPYADTVYTDTLRVFISCDTPESVIEYRISVDDRENWSEWEQFDSDEPVIVPLDTDMVIEAFSSRQYWVTSDTVSTVYRVTGKLDLPRFTLLADTIYVEPIDVYIEHPSNDARIEYSYSTDDSLNWSEWEVYEEPIGVGFDTVMHIRAIAFQDDWLPSDTTSVTYKVTGKTAKVEFYPPPDTIYTSPVDIAFSTITENAGINYRTSPDSGYSWTDWMQAEDDTLHIPKDTYLLIQAFSSREHWVNSDTLEVFYLVTGRVSSPLFSHDSEIIYTEPISVDIGTSTEGAVIEYSYRENVRTKQTINPSNVRTGQRSVHSGSIAKRSEWSDWQILTGKISVGIDTEIDIRARALKEHWLISDTTYVSYTVTGTVGKPEVSPSPDSIYTEPVEITIETDTPQAGITYRVSPDRGLNWSGWLEYTGTPVSVPNHTEKLLQIYAHRELWANSDTLNVTYQVTGKASNPFFSHNPDTVYVEEIDVKIMTETDNADILYSYLIVRTGHRACPSNVRTEQCSVPTPVKPSSSPERSEWSEWIRFEESLKVSYDTTIHLKAKAVKEHWAESDTVFASYIVTGKLAPPVSEPETGVYKEPFKLTVENECEETIIRYTFDDSEPDQQSNRYTQPIIIDSTSIVKLKAFRDNWLPSDTVTLYYTFLPIPANLSAEAGYKYVELSWDEVRNATSEQRNVRTGHRACPSNVGTGYHTVQNLSTPFLSYPLPVFTGYNVYRKVNDTFILVNDTPLYEAYYYDDFVSPGRAVYYVTALFDEYESASSDTLSVLVPDKVAVPRFEPQPGTYDRLLSIVITTETVDALIYYTLDGTEPTMESQLFTGEIVSDTTVTIIARAFKEGWEPSDLVEAEYIIEISEDDDILPELTELLAAYPNPFNPSTNIPFNLAEPGRVKITVYNVRGQLVAKLVDNQHYQAGTYTTSWSGRDSFGRQVGSGVYYYRMETSGYSSVRKMLLLK